MRAGILKGETDREGNGQLDHCSESKSAMKDDVLKDSLKLYGFQIKSIQ